MAVMIPRERWTDERLDDLNKKVDDGFARVDADMREVRAEIKDLKAEMNSRFDSINRSMWAGFIAIVGSNVTLILTLS